MEDKDMQLETSKMSTRGQIVIPREIREKMSLRKDTLFMVGSLDSETIIMKKLDKTRMVDEFLKLRKAILRRSGGLSTKDIGAEIDAARKENQGGVGH